MILLPHRGKKSPPVKGVGAIKKGEGRDTPLGFLNLRRRFKNPRGVSLPSPLFIAPPPFTGGEFLPLWGKKIIGAIKIPLWGIGGMLLFKSP